METDPAGARIIGGGSPDAFGDGLFDLTLIPEGPAMLADVASATILDPLDRAPIQVELQELLKGALWAGDKVAALVGLLIEPLDTGTCLVFWGRSQNDLPRVL